MTVCRARLSWRSPPRLSRCRVVWPLEAGIGATPASRAKAASERTRPWCDQADDQLGGDDRADAGLVEQPGCERAHVGEDLAFELVRLRRSRPGRGGRGCAARASWRARRVCASSSGGSGCSGRAAAAQAARAARSRSSSGAVTITLRSCTSASRRTSTALRRATISSRSASRRCPARGSASVSLASAARAARVASSASSLPLQPPLVARAAASLEHRLAAAAEIASEPGAVMACALDRPDAAAGCVLVSEREAPARTRARSPAPTAAPQPRPSTRPRPRARARPDACRHRRRNPPDLQASLLILRLRLVGSGDAGLSAGKPQRQDCDESRPQGGQAPDQANSGRQTGAALPPGQIIPKARPRRPVT